MARKEYDSLGCVEVDDGKLWGAQTERSLRNFSVGKQKMPLEIVHAIANIKKAAALTNAKLGVLDKTKAEMIVEGAEAIVAGKLDEHFPLSLWQTGSGTHTNMNVNEVIVNFVNSKRHKDLGSKDLLHPNNDVNKSQSSNDVFPTAIHIAVLKLAKSILIPSLSYFLTICKKKSEEFKDIVKCGRTHMMDGVPMRLGDEFSAFASSLELLLERVDVGLQYLCKIALGGTAVGTGLNAPVGYDLEVAKSLSKILSLDLVPCNNKFEGISSVEPLISFSAILRSIASVYLKICNDLRLLASGPRCGLGEIILPANEPGSSIMPGKVNPTQCEMLTQVATQVYGNDTAVAIGGFQGHLQLNVYRPLIAYNILDSILILSEGARSFVDNCLSGIQPNKDRIFKHLEDSLMLVTALNPIIGYDKSAEIGKLAYKKSITLREAALELNFVTKEEYDKYVDPISMSKKT